MHEAKKLTVGKRSGAVLAQITQSLLPEGVELTLSNFADLPPKTGIGGNSKKRRWSLRETDRYDTN